MIYIGIDPGTKTGIAILIEGQYEIISTKTIIEAMEYVKFISVGDYSEIEIHIENPNLRKWHKEKDISHKAQGAGSIKRDYAIWEEFCKLHGIKMVDVAPQSIGSTFDNEAIFKQATGWQGRTSQHARDAAKIVFRFYYK